MPKISLSDIIGLSGIVLAVVLVVLDKAGKLKGHWLYILLAVAALMTLFIAIGNSWVMDAPSRWKLWRAGFMFCVVVFAYSGIALWISSVLPTNEESPSSLPTAPRGIPSLVFVFGVPLGDNDSASWMMMLKHYGPNPAYSCNIDFYDNDRKNIEHQWLVAHPDSPYPPPGLAAGESQKHVYVTETGPEGSAGGFPWNPLDPDRQHYTVSITCRDGVFVEKWEVTRVEGILRSTITIEHGPQWVQNNSTLDPVVFRCSDPEFISTPLAIEVPKLSKRVVHPGWKPNHRFEVPAAIIDPNGNMQVVYAIKLPDGSTQTDFGCWNILTQHVGDAPSTQR
ncbi:MAG: hypothetical protein ABSD64_02520 [Terriglobales bacterium]|jgi:hypothetical protein